MRDGDGSRDGAKEILRNDQVGATGLSNRLFPYPAQIASGRIRRQPPRKAACNGGDCRPLQRGSPEQI